MTEISIILNGADEDNAAKTENKPLLIGGKVVDPETYTPEYSVGDAAMVAFDQNGALLVSPSALSKDKDSITTHKGECEVHTYSAGVTSLNLGGSGAATDIFEIRGSSSKIIRIKSITFSATGTTVGIKSVSLVKRSSANSGGTSTDLPIVPHDSNNPTPSAIVKAYTSNPVLGTLAGIIKTVKLPIPTISGANSWVQSFDFGINREQSIALRSENEILAINMNNNNLGASGSFDACITWTEDEKPS